MSNRRRRRPAHETRWREIRPGADFSRCSHCGSSDLAWLTRDEFADHTAAYGVELVPGWDAAEVNRPADAPDFHWFFCNDCRQGGTVGWSA